jgi:prepilin-type N-terminal cleavage/methylation domain-containing protein
VGWAADDRGGAADQPPDVGFTLIEVLLALSLVSLVAAFALTFHFSSATAVRTQANRQVAAQLASEALDEARAAGGAALLAAPPAPAAVTINKVSFQRRWSVSACREATPGAGCTAAQPGPGVVDLARVVVTVQWNEADKTRVESAVAMVSTAADPVFGS